MVGAIINAIGILLVAVGTIFTLWTILSTRAKDAGTYGELARRHQDFPKEKKRTIVGCVIIGIGSIIQIVGQFL